MKTIKIITTFIICMSCTLLYAENLDSLKVVQLTQIIQQDSLRIVLLENGLKKEAQNVKRLSSELSQLKSGFNSQTNLIDSLKQSINQNSQNISSTANALGIKITETNNTLSHKADQSDIEQKSIIGIFIFVFLALISIGIYLILQNKIKNGNKNVESLKQKAEKLNEDILNQLSLEMVEIQKISSSLATISKSNTSNDSSSSTPDHSLIKALADRITFMEMTLYKMDSKVRGYKQLSRSISQMKENLLANGYEIVEMLGKSYNDGMKVTANFIEDEDLENGQQIITGIIKPQINYKGVMIQSAQITVSQNI